MWLERFMIIVASLERDFLPSSWHMFYPTFWDLATLAGSIGAFALLFLLFLRFLPAISMSELRKEAHEKPIVAGRSHERPIDALRARRRSSPIRTR